MRFAKTIASYSLGGYDQSRNGDLATARGLVAVTSKTRLARLEALGIPAEEWHHVGRTARAVDFFKAATVHAISRMTRKEFLAAVARRESRRMSQPVVAAVSRKHETQLVQDGWKFFPSGLGISSTVKLFWNPAAC
jgi:hypothetical protein